jgi:S-adenosylmethionine synthetase
MPLPIMLAHKLACGSPRCGKSGLVDYLRPDGKTQVTVEYEGDKPSRIDTVVVSTQHAETRRTSASRPTSSKHVIMPLMPKRC